MNRRTIIIGAITALLAALGWCASAGWAAAGGPTSVLLVNPETRVASALYYTQPAYDRLADAVDAYADGAGTTTRPSTVTDGFEGEVRLTWMIHDMIIWRVDRVHFSTAGGTWLETLTAPPEGGDVFARPGRWHRPVDDAALKAALAKAGLISAAAAKVKPTEPAVRSSSPAGPVPVESASSATPTGLIASGAGIAGLVLGLAGSVVLRRVRAGQREGFVLTG